MIDFIKSASRIARKAVIFNDLHRHLFATWGYAFLSPLLFRNRLTIHDGLVSIRRGFKEEDWQYYMRKAGIPEKAWGVAWKWAFRWIITIKADNLAM